jgi:signal transduction histidine kinase
MSASIPPPVPPSSASRLPLKATTVVLALLILAINGLALREIVRARRTAEAAAISELHSQVAADAREVASALARLRGDLLFLAHSLASSQVLEGMASGDPFRSRWSRLDGEGRILLFLQSHPAIERISLVHEDSGPLIVAGRRGGAPLTLPPTAKSPRPGEASPGFSRWPLGEGARAQLEVLLTPRALLETLGGDEADEVQLAVGGAAGEPAPREGWLVAEAAVEDRSWDPVVRWTLQRARAEGRLMDSVEEVTDRYRATVVTSGILLVLATGVGLLALHEARRAARAEAEARSQVRLRELEAGLQHSERLASLGRVAAGIAHEINNPLEGMANWLRLLEQDLAAGDAKEGSVHARRLRDGLDRIAAIVGRTLRIAAPGQGHMEALDLRTVVARSVEFARATPAARGIEIRFQEEGEPIPVRGDPTTLEQLAMNVLLNACEAGSQGGPIDVQVQAARGYAELRVADRGPGLPSGGEERIFEPFYSTKGSTGLGLAVSLGIATQHGGILRAESRSGGGAIFRFRLPLAGGRRGTFAGEERVS